MSAPTLDLAATLDALASPESPFAAGSGAAIAGAVAAAVTSKVARSSNLGAAAAQADALRGRLERLAATDAQAFAAARSALDSVTEGGATEGGDDRADFQLGRALSEAAAAPLAIGEACADVAEIAGWLAVSAEPSLQPDAAAAALLAAAGASAAAVLVDANLAVSAGDDRAARAHAAADAASAAASSIGT